MKSKNNPFRYYFLGTQIALTVFVSVFLAYKIDVFFSHQIPFITILIAIVVIFHSLYRLVQDVNKEK